MSFKLVKKVIHTDRVDGTHKLVLIILADYVNEAKGNASWPALSTVAQQAGLSTRHARRIIRELEVEGVLKTIKQAGLRGTNKYVIDVSPVVGADTHVPRTYKEQIRTDTFAVGAPSGRAPDGSLVNTINNSDAPGMAVAADAPKCTEHDEVTTSCATCYTWQYEQWRKEPISCLAKKSQKAQRII